MATTAIPGGSVPTCRRAAVAVVVGILGGGLLGGDRDGAALVDLRAGRGILRLDDRIIGRVAGDLQREVAAQRGLAPAIVLPRRLGTLTCGLPVDT